MNIKTHIGPVSITGEAEISDANVATFVERSALLAIAAAVRKGEKDYKNETATADFVAAKLAKGVEGMTLLGLTFGVWEPSGDGAKLRAENEALKARLAALEARLGA